MKIKCLTSLLLLGALLFSALSSCKGEQVSDTPDTSDTSVTVTEAAEEAIPEEPPFNEEEARQKIYDAMVGLAGIEWTPKTTFDISTPSSKYLRGLIYEAGTKYKGAPYTNGIDGTAKTFTAALENGVYTGGTTKASVIGFDCSSAVAEAWKSVNPDITCMSTKEMFPKQGHGVEPVGFYDYGARTSLLTTEITAASGEQTIFEAYSLLKKGDAVMTRWASEAAHVRLVSSEPVVVRFGDGSIDASNSYILYCDQTSTIREFEQYKSSWQIDEKVTFRSLFDNWYIPICLEDFYENRSDEAEFTINGMNDPASFPSRLSGQIGCSQKIKSGKISLLDENGDEIYSDIKEIDSYIMQISAFSYAKLNAALSGRSEKMTFAVSVVTYKDSNFIEATRFEFSK